MVVYILTHERVQKIWDDGLEMELTTLNAWNQTNKVVKTLAEEPMGITTIGMIFRYVRMARRESECLMRCSHLE